MGARVQMESARRVSDCVTALLRGQPFFGSLALRLPRRRVAKDGDTRPQAPGAWAAVNTSCRRAGHGRRT